MVTNSRPGVNVRIPGLSAALIIVLAMFAGFLGSAAAMLALHLG